MEQKPKGAAVQVVADEVKASLGRRAGLLTGEEERTLRMRHGAAVDRQAPLARAAGGNAELEDELLLIEMQLMRSRLQAGKVQGLPTLKKSVAVAPSASPTKSKIVRALRRKR
jgi:hypothetical protein